MTARCLNCSATSSLLSMLVPKPQFERGLRKKLPQKSKFRLKILIRNLVLKTIEHFGFWKSCMTNQLKLIFPKKHGFWSWKGSNIWILVYALCWALRTGSMSFCWSLRTNSMVFFVGSKDKQKPILLVYRE